MNPEELPIPKNVQDGLYRLLGEGWDDSANAIYEYIDEQAKQIAAYQDALITECDRTVGCRKETLDYLKLSYPDIDWGDVV